MLVIVKLWKSNELCNYRFMESISQFQSARRCDMYYMISGSPSRQIIAVKAPMLSLLGAVVWPEKLIVIDLN